MMERATWESSNIISTMAMAHFIGLTMDTHTLGSIKMVTEMAMVLIHGLMEKLITDSKKNNLRYYFLQKL